MKQESTRIALITGGSSGIGNAVVHRLAQENFRIVSADIVPPPDEKDNVHYIQCDVTKGYDVDQLHTKIITEIGCPDVIVLNAGQGIHELLTDGDPEKWQQVMDLNVMGVLRCIRSFVPLMQKNKKGNVVFVSSVAADKAYTYGGVYSATKAAIEAIAETLRLEVLPDIRVITIRAGATATSFFEKANHTSAYAETLAAKDIADDIWYAINKPAGTVINTIITRPAKQEF